MKTIIVLLFLISFSFPDSYSQVSQQWATSYNGSGNGSDNASSIAIDNSGNVYVTGYCKGTGNSDEDYVTIKYNLTGVQQWAKIYNGTGDSSDFAYKVVVDNSGNVYVTGYSYSNTSDFDFTTIKYNSSGDSLWVKRYNGPGNYVDFAYDLKVDASGNVYVTGTSFSSSTSLDYATVKYNSSGVQQWVQRYNFTAAPDDDVANAIIVDAAGNVYVTGVSWGGISTFGDYATIKYNTLGVQQWVRRYNGTANSQDFAYAIAMDRYGTNVYVTGLVSGSGASAFYGTVKYDSSGTQQWIGLYTGPSNDNSANAIGVDSSGNVYVTGRSKGSSTNYDYATLKYNSNGTQQWEQRFNGSSNGIDIAYSIALDQYSNVYVTGYTSNTGVGNDYTTIKYNSAGTQQWLQTYNGTGNSNDEAHSVTVDTSGSVYITGQSTGSGTNYDYTTIKYSPLVGIFQISSIVNNFSLSQNYPNPFNPTTNIEFQIPANGFVKLIIYNMLGEEIETLVSKQMQPGIYIVDFNGSKLASGVYFYTLRTNNYSETKKMLLIK